MWAVGKTLEKTLQAPNTGGEWGGISDFETLAMPLFDSLYNFANWLSSNREDADDLVQETFLKALKNFHSFEPGTNFKAWMFTILRNTFYSEFSRVERKNTVSFETEDELPPLMSTLNPESQFLDYLGVKQIWSAIEQLPLGFREVFLLREVEEASYSEIAEILSIPVGTVMSRLSRARSNLRATLSQSMERPPIDSFLPSSSMMQEATLNEA
jgi:RNA polymerase sigma-70 factor, ECF subfamily